jgi:hypothetical protein
MITNMNSFHSKFLIFLKKHSRSDLIHVPSSGIENAIIIAQRHATMSSGDWVDARFFSGTENWEYLRLGWSENMKKSVKVKFTSKVHALMQIFSI